MSRLPSIRRLVAVRATLVAAAIFGAMFLPRPAARAQSAGGSLMISGGGSLTYTGSSTLTLGGTPTVSSTLTLIGGGTVTVFGGGTITLMPMPGYTGNLTHQHFFASEQYVSNGVFYMALPNGSPFGFYSFLGPYQIPLTGSTGGGWIYHFDLGYEYVVDPNDGHNGVYLYDDKTGDYFYTSPTFPFPYLYDLTLNAVLYYYPDPANPGRYNTNGVRYFYNFATGQIITK